jgi:Asp-tRNA(Asn)/Glu-tRNA(Gln) amidotransferase A subunit family amidase
VTELCDLSAVELRARIGDGEISPVELWESCLARIAAVDPALNAIVALDAERTRAAAERAERAVRAGEPLGLLHGLPLGIKDLNETAGLVTTYGSPLYADFVPAADCGVVARLRAAGGLIAAKTNTPEFGAGANTWNTVYGVTGNPFDPTKTCAGSSGGSAVALATSMLPLANGSDLGGSLRTPAAFCGVVGLRPTPGTVADETRSLAYSPLSVEGPLARSVPDLALLFAALIGSDPRDPLSRPQSRDQLTTLPEIDLGEVRAAYSEDLGFAPISAAVRRLFRQRRARLGDFFASCEPRDPDLGEATRAFEVLRAVGFMASHLDKLRAHPEEVGPNVTANIELGLRMSAREVAWAGAEQTRLIHRFLAFMEDHDVLICPAAAVPPFAKDQLFPREIDGRELETYISWLAITYGLTLLGHPVLCLPCGRDEAGLPFGLQLVGKRFGEAHLLAIGAALERAQAKLPDCARPLPDLAKLTSLAADGAQ